MKTALMTRKKEWPYASSGTNKQRKNVALRHFLLLILKIKQIQSGHIILEAVNFAMDDVDEHLAGG